MSRSHYNGFTVITSHEEAVGRELFDAVLSGEIKREKIFRDNKRTLSVKVVFQGRSLMLKVHRARNSRYWERFLTLFRVSDAVRSHQHMELMKRLGFTAPDPVFSCEYRKHGVVIDSFMCYRFVDGKPAEASDAQKVLAALIALHKCGYLRGDAQLANFLVSEDTVVFIDFRLKKTWFLPQLQKARELDRFVRSCPEAREHLSRERIGTLWLQVAAFLESLSFGIRILKKRTRARVRRLHSARSR